MRRFRPRAVLLALVLITSCAVHTVGDAGRARADLEAARQLDRQLTAGRWSLLEKCMSAKGFQIHPVRTSPALEFAAPTGLSPAPQQAEATGYEITRPPDDYDKQPADYRSRYNASLDGCLPEVDRVLFGQSGVPPRAPIADIQAAASAAFTRAKPPAAVAGWSRCLREAGYQAFRFPADARHYASTLSREQQRKLAVADAGCAETTKVNTEISVLWEQKLDEVLAADEGKLAAFRDQLAEQVKRALTS
ncbi:hypothetical protein [Amycolatopsis sp. NPDC059657]|uniref:hypothetical protein n=1 Tax=Amycolatopsis sp. NPDC059657 TaxID=3346899 RepID=UPI0036731052